MTELVEMLRTPTGCVPPTKWELLAADRIEALEAALHKIDDTSIDHVAVKIARDALAPEQDK